MKREKKRKLFLPRTNTNQHEPVVRFRSASSCGLSGSWLIILLNLCVASNISALDFGIVLHQNAAVFNTADNGEPVFEYNALLVPRLSFLAGENGAVFISAALNFGYNDEFYIAPELMRAEYSVQGRSFGFRIGRINYSDPASFIVSGLFDGFHLTHSSRAGRFGLGAWYAGFQYKKSANITMAQDELASYNSPLDYADFTNTYFASSRLIASFDWEHLSLFGGLRLNANVTGQFDLRNADEKINTQYFSLRPGLRLNGFLFELGGVLQMMQTETDGASGSYLAYAGEFGVYWTLPVNIDSRLSLVARYASGSTQDTNAGAFVPVSTVYQGEINQVKLSSLAVAKLNYTARLSRTLGTDLSVSCFLSEEFDYHGMEIFARFVWSPLSDLQFNLGGGAFLSEDKPQWRCNITAILAY